MSDDPIEALRRWRAEQEAALPQGGSGSDRAPALWRAERRAAQRDPVVAGWLEAEAEAERAESERAWLAALATAEAEARQEDAETTRRLVERVLQLVRETGAPAKSGNYRTGAGTRLGASVIGHYFEKHREPPPGRSTQAQADVVLHFAIMSGVVPDDVPLEPSRSFGELVQAFVDGWNGKW